MSELIKKPYEISLWGERTEVIDDDQGKNIYIKEYPIAIIGSNTMDSPIKAFEPKLVRQTNGTNTLTFQVFYRYYDIETNSFKLNPFIGLLTNERKIKLKYDDKWYDLVIKQIQEDSQKETFTYTCQDLYISELSKNGYSLIFDTELENNMGSVTELGAEIVKGTEWSISEDSDILLQKNEEAIFTYVLDGALSNYKKHSYENGAENTINGTEIIDSGQVLYISYSSFQNWEKGKEIYFHWVKNGLVEIDDDRIITNSPVYSFIPAWVTKPELKVTTSYRGIFPVSSNKVVYVPEIEKYCNIYKDTITNKEYYCYIGSEFLAATEVQNLLTNSTNFSSTFGWEGAVTSSTPQQISFNFSSGNVINSGLSDSIAAFQDYNGIATGDVYYLLVKNGTNTGSLKPKFWLRKSGDSTGVAFTNYSKLSTTLRSGYDSYKITCNNSYSYSSLINERGSNKLEFVLGGSGTCTTSELSLFKEVKVNSQVVLPDMGSVLDTAMKDKYFFFDPSQLTSKIITDVADLVFYKKCFKEEIPSTLIPVLRDRPFEKITSITASKSNRFNLIQKLCETFECWARFEIKHDVLGATAHKYFITKDTKAVEGKTYYKKINSGDNDNPANFRITSFSAGVYEHSLDKQIIFKEYIGKDNYAGFRYGINLKSITRNIDSKQIVTKLIVESNSNQYANDGFCSIQRAAMNPIRENSIYNFKYYINNGLISETELIADLYDNDNGIGLYSKLLEYNLAAEPGIEKLVELKTAYDKALAYYTYHNFAMEEAKSNATEYTSQLIEIVGSAPSTPNDEAYNDTVNELIRKRNYANSTVTREEGCVSYITPIVTSYKTEIAELEEILATYTEKKELLYAEFFKKYSRYVQEGTWISEEYTDPDLYYFDACKVSETSAFPQISYNINVLEISGMEEYKNYNFDIGDKTYIEDTEFFGYDPTTGRPYQEEVIISEIQSFLDSPEKNTIKVQNYKTRFEDLFQRVAAATQALQYHEGEYNRASSAIKENNTIDGSVLERTLNFNYCLSSAVSKEISQGGQYIELNSVTQPNRFVRISALGIELSKDGGLNWQTAITADGINADVGVFGSLHTNNLTIYNGDSEAFYWDKDGITALGVDGGGNTIYNKFVRFSKFGIYGHIGERSDHYKPISLDEIKKNSVFSLTWDGFALNSLSGGNYVRISTEGEASGTTHGKKIFWAGKTTIGTPTDQFIVYEDGSIFANSGNFKGDITGASGTFSGTISATDGSIGGWNISKNGLWYGGTADNPTYGIMTSGDKRLKITDNFYVTSGGKLYATGADISGSITATSGSFTGTLNALAGDFYEYVDAKGFRVYNYTKSEDGYTKGTSSGFVGSAQGKDADENTTYGVMLASGISGSTASGPYTIVTTAGVRLQAGDNRIVVTKNSITASDGTKSVNLLEGGGGVAVFG